MKTISLTLGLSLLFVLGCANKSDKKSPPAPEPEISEPVTDKKSDDASPVPDEKKSDDSKKPDESAPAPVVPVAPEVPPVAPERKGFVFTDVNANEIPLYVRGDMNNWLGAPTSDQLASSQLLFQSATGCYEGTLNLEAKSFNFRLAAYLSADPSTGWNFMKVGAGPTGTNKSLKLGESQAVDVYYFPAGDAEGKDFGGGGNLNLRIENEGSYAFAFCVNPDNYSDATLLISKK